MNFDLRYGEEMFKKLDKMLRKILLEYSETLEEKIIDHQTAEIEKLKVDMSALRADIFRGVEKAISNSKMNERAFEQYKNKYQGKKIVICGAGPSLVDFKPIEDTIYIALNRTFLFDKVKFDYIFVQDYRGIELITEELKEYRPGDCVKFFGTQNGSLDDEIPESYAIACNAVRYATDGYIWLHEEKCGFTFEMNSKSVGNFATIALPALQFALWTNPSEIYIVGCDSTQSGHFVGQETETVLKLATEDVYARMIEEWKEVAIYAKLYYPNTKIFSINPIGLKGIFEDINYN